MAFVQLTFPLQMPFKQQYLIHFHRIQNSNLRHFIKHPLIPVGTLPLKPKHRQGLLFHLKYHVNVSRTLCSDQTAFL